MKRKTQAEANMDKIKLNDKEVKFVNWLLDPSNPRGKRVRHTPKSHQVIHRDSPH